MCGRFALKNPSKELKAYYQTGNLIEFPASYNIAPSLPVMTIHASEHSRRMDLMRWGLVPSWAKDPAIGNKMINARAETVATKPAFRTAFKRRRCLIRMAKDRAFAFAGLWETWHGNDGSALDSCTIVTTDANDLMWPLHDRMPVILPEENFAEWLDPKNENVPELEALLRPYSPDEMTAFPISTLVNSPRNDCAECIARASA